MKTSRWALLVLTPVCAWATTMIALDLPAKTRVAEAIVHGTVTKVEAHLSRDGRRISTQVDVEVKEAIKGQVGKTVSIIQPGGEVGDIGQLVSGTAHYTVGEEVVLFLERHGPNFRTVGMAQGKYRVERSTDGKAAFALPEPEGDATFVDPATHVPVAKTEQVLKLETFKEQIRSAIGPAVRDSSP